MKYLLALIVFATFSQMTSAKSNYLYHKKMKQMMMVSNVDEQAGTAIYRDPISYEKITVQLSDLVEESEGPINGVHPYKNSIVNYPHHQYCEVYHIFKNGIAYMDCYVSSYKDEFGRTVPGDIVRYYDHVSRHIGEVEYVGEFVKKDKVKLLKAYGEIEADSTVTIESIYPSGEAIVKWKNKNLFNGKAMIYTKRVKIEDLAKY